MKEGGGGCDVGYLWDERIQYILGKVNEVNQMFLFNLIGNFQFEEKRI